MAFLSVRLMRVEGRIEKGIKRKMDKETFLAMLRQEYSQKAFTFLLEAVEYLSDDDLLSTDDERIYKWVFIRYLVRRKLFSARGGLLIDMALPRSGLC